MDQKRQETPAAGIVTDSRQVKENFVFVALPGERVDGHDFIPQVFAAGALAVVCEREPEQAAGVYLLVESSKEALKSWQRSIWMSLRFRSSVLPEVSERPAQRK